MKYLKMLSLAAVAAGAVMAFIGAGTASATVLCTATEVDCTLNKIGVNQVLDASVEESAHLKTSGGTTIATCTEGTVKGPIKSAGSTSETVIGEVQTLTWSNCNTTVDTLAGGTLEVHWTEKDRGSVTSNGAKVTINFLGASCVFETKNTNIGTLTGRTETGGAATFDINGTIPGVTGGLCPASGIWSGKYKFTGENSVFDVVKG